MVKQIDGIDTADNINDMAPRGLRICKPCFTIYTNESHLRLVTLESKNEHIEYTFESLGHLLASHTCIGDNDMAEGNEQFYCWCACTC